MAFGLSTDNEQPQHTTVSRYAINRLGNVPSVTVSYAETVDAMEAPVRLESVAPDGMGMVVPAWNGRTDLVGRKVVSSSSKALLAVITGVTPAVLDSQGEVVTPETVTVDTLLDPAVAGTGITTPFINAVGSVAHVQAGAGRAWEVTLPMQGPGATRATAMLISATVKLVAKALIELGDTTTTLSQIQAAVMAMAAKGINVDGILAEEAELLELDRQAGLLPWVSTVGFAPRVRAI